MQMIDLTRKTLPYILFTLAGLGFTSWVRPFTDDGYQALFLTSFLVLSALWLLVVLVVSFFR